MSESATAPCPCNGTGLLHKKGWAQPAVSRIFSRHYNHLIKIASELLNMGASARRDTEYRMQNQVVIMSSKSLSE